VENKSGRDGQTFLNPQYARGIGVMKKTKWFLIYMKFTGVNGPTWPANYPVELRTL
jgi:hypothetical protein